MNKEYCQPYLWDECPEDCTDCVNYDDLEEEDNLICSTVVSQLIQPEGIESPQ